MAVIPSLYLSITTARPHVVRDASTPQGATLAPASSTTLLHSTSKTSATTSNPMIAAMTSSPMPDPGLSTGVKAGIGVGVVIVGLILSFILLFFAVRQIQYQQHVQRMKALRAESERGMRNAAAFQSALPPQFLEHDDMEWSEEDHPLKPPKPVAKPLIKRGMACLSEKEVVVDWKQMGKRLSRWKERPDPAEFDTQLKRPPNILEAVDDSWV